MVDGTTTKSEAASTPPADSFSAKAPHRGHKTLIRAIVLLIAASLAALGAMSGCSNGVSYKTPVGTSTVTVVASSDPYISGSTSSTQACGIVPGSTPPTASPALAPCAQQTFQVSLTVQ